MDGTLHMRSPSVRRANQTPETKSAFSSSVFVSRSMKTDLVHINPNNQGMSSSFETVITFQGGGDKEISIYFINTKTNHFLDVKFSESAFDANIWVLKGSVEVVVLLTLITVKIAKSKRLTSGTISNKSDNFPLRQSFSPNRTCWRFLCIIPG